MVNFASWHILCIELHVYVYCACLFQIVWSVNLVVAKSAETTTALNKEVLTKSKGTLWSLGFEPTFQHATTVVLM